MPLPVLRDRCRIRAATLYERLAAISAADRIVKTSTGYRLAGAIAGDQVTLCALAHPPNRRVEGSLQRRGRRWFLPMQEARRSRCKPDHAH
jgi:hypothetical protein